MIKNVLITVLVGASLIEPAVADESIPASESGRYSFNKVAEGFLRLDTQNRDVSLCSRRCVGFACQAVPDDRAVLENEIARLRHANAALKQELLPRGLPLPSGSTPEPPLVRDDGRLPQFAEQSDLDRMFALVRRIWHRLVDPIARAQRQMLNKS